MAEQFTNGGTKVIMPDVGDNTVQFNPYYQQQVEPFCIYVFCESYENVNFLMELLVEIG